MKKVMLVLIGIMSGLFLCGCASMARTKKSWSSDMNGGLNRILNVYTIDGKLIASYEGKIDIDDNANGSIMFDLDDKRYVYYNAIIEVIEK